MRGGRWLKARGGQRTFPGLLVGRTPFPSLALGDLNAQSRRWVGPGLARNRGVWAAAPGWVAAAQPLKPTVLCAEATLPPVRHFTAQ